MKLIEYIPHGRSNAIAMRELSERLNIDPRKLRALIQHEREQGAPICSDWERGGYFMPTNESEALMYYRKPRRRSTRISSGLTNIPPCTRLLTAYRPICARLSVSITSSS